MESQKKAAILNRDEIKYFAIIAMLLNHIAGIFMEPGTLLAEIFFDIGYFAGITFCYFLVEGYQNTHSKRDYGIRLAIFAVLSQFPFHYAMNNNGFSMMYTLLICFMILAAREKISDKGLCIAAEILLIIASINGDWPLLAPILVILFDRCRMKKFSFVGTYVVAVIGFALLKYLHYREIFSPLRTFICTLGACFGIILSGIVLKFLYNGKRAKYAKNFSKWFFYIFYPAHLFLRAMSQSL